MDPSRHAAAAGIRRLLGCLSLGLLSLLVGAGCGSNGGGGADSTERFVPTAVDAEAALRKVLESWREGQAVGMLPDTKPNVHITDTFRKPGERLVDYQILGEVPADHPRCFAVDLRFEPERMERSRFTVVGIDPLWVMRAEDAELLSHWEHNMKSPAADESRPGAQNEIERPGAAVAEPVQGESPRTATQLEGVP